MSGTLSLAATIAQLSQDDLRSLVRARWIAAPDAVRDPIGLAIELLKPESIARALRGAHRDQLAALAELSRDALPSAEQLQLLALSGLVGSDSDGKYVALQEVTDAARQLAPGDAAALQEFPETPSATAAEVDVSSWFGAALTSARRVAAMLRALEYRPARLGRRDFVTVQAVRELAQTIHCEPESVDVLLTPLRSGGMLQAVSDHRGEVLGTSERAAGWLDLDYPERWLVLAQQVLGEMDPRLRLSLAKNDFNLSAASARVAHDYPLLPEQDREAHQRLAATTEELGITVLGAFSPAARLLADGDTIDALALAERDIPGVVNGVYVQPDLSLVVPGPLAPADEAALSRFTDTEQLSAAAVLRINNASITRAMRHGMSITEIRSTLERLSLTGIPQPLDYLLSDLERQGIPAHPLDGFAFATATHPHVERSSDPRPAATKQASDDALAERVHAASQQSGDLTRRLELAIRERETVVVTAVAGRDEHSFTLAPVSLKDGRLRATDQRADVERTIPVTAIIAVEAA